MIDDDDLDYHAPLRRTKSGKFDLSMNSEREFQLRHPGKWITAKWQKGKKISGTGFWDCCGSEVHYGENCPSLEARRDHQVRIFREQVIKEKAADRQAQAKVLREKWENERYQARLAAAGLGAAAAGLGGADAGLLAAADRLRRAEDPEWAQALRRRGRKAPDFFTLQAREQAQRRLESQSRASGVFAGAVDNGAVPGLAQKLAEDPLGPAPMVLRVLGESAHHPELQESCLRQLLGLAALPGGCRRLLGRGAAPTLLRALGARAGEPRPVALILKIFDALASHEDTHYELLQNFEFVSYILSTVQTWKLWDEVLQEAFSLMRTILKEDHYLQAAVDRGVTTLLISSLHRHSDKPGLLQASFAMLGRLAELGPAVCTELLRHEVVETALDSLEKDAGEPQVMVAALDLLLRLCASAEGASGRALARGCVGRVLRTLKALPGKEELQLSGLQFLAKLAETDQGRRELDAVPGSWQWLTAGVAQGDRLVHLHAGALSDPGFWLPAAAEGALFEDGAPAGDHAWSVQRLKEFMGVASVKQALDGNNKYYHKYFKLVKGFGLLPKAGETQGEWHSRLRQYQRENFIDIDLLAKRHK